jgi:O-antigen ligase
MFNRPATGWGWGWIIAFVVLLCVLALLIFSGLGAPSWLPLALLGLLALAMVIG